jgi:hypothetical protein
MKAVLTVALIAFFVTLAVIIGKRMSTDAMAVLIGVACGVIASIPTSLLILAVTSRRNRGVEEYTPPQPQVPPVVVIQGGQAEYPKMPLLGGPSVRRSREPRQFELVGQTEEEVWE